MASSPIPFAEGAPSDGLQIEVIGDDVLIGDPELDVEQAPESQFDENLAEELDSRDSSATADSLVSLYESDREARSEWEQRYKSGLKTLDPDGGLEEGEDQRATRRSSNPVQCACRSRALSFRWSGQDNNHWRPRRRD